MRANFLAEEGPDVRFACKEIARLMSEPCEAGWEKLKRLGRYLAGVPRLVQRTDEQQVSQIQSEENAAESGEERRRGGDGLPRWSETKGMRKERSCCSRGRK